MTLAGGLSRDAQRTRAAQLIDLKRYDEALALLHAILAADPDDVSSLCLAAYAELRQGAAQTCTTLARRALAADPTEGWAARLLAMGLTDLGQAHRARSAAEAAVRLDPLNWHAHAVLAEAALLEPSTYPLALTSAQRAVELAPQEAQAHVAAAQVAIQVKEFDAAMRSVREALRLDPQSPEGLNALGRLNAETNRPLQAVTQFAAAAALEPHDPTAAANLVMGVWLALSSAQMIGFLVVYLSALPLLGYSGPEGQGVGAFFAGLILAGIVGLLIYLRTHFGRRVWRHIRAAAQLERRVIWIAAVLVAALALVLIGLLQPGNSTRFHFWLAAAGMNTIGIIALAATLRVRPREAAFALLVPTIWVLGMIVNYHSARR